MSAVGLFFIKKLVATGMTAVEIEVAGAATKEVRGVATVKVAAAGMAVLDAGMAVVEVIIG